MAANNPYKDTIFLPQTEFSMKAQLSVNEPIQLKSWDVEHIYTKMVKLRDGQKSYILHDGPPYANGNIHHGHCLNKILKDIAVKMKHFDGYQVNFIPGWDCHGLPIEHEVEKKEKVSLLNTPRAEIRKRCRAYAQRFVDLQREQFKTLGVFGEWNTPYITMDPVYEAKDLEVLAKFIEAGTVYKKKKPVHWSTACQTSLAGSEVEYKEVEDDSIYVICPLSAQNTVLSDKLKNTAVVFWTTTPWSIPAVLAVSLKSDATYGAYNTDKGTLIVATALKDDINKHTHARLDSPLWTLTGKELEHALFVNPITHQDIPLVLGEHVSLETGTGCVSTAPGHGEDDYQVGLKYGLDIYCPVDSHGKFTKDVPQYQGTLVFKANPHIIKDLQDDHKLLGHTKIKHTYPHCWRSKTPAVLRATEQWFIDVDKTKLRKTCIDAIKNVKWIPDWSEIRMTKMLETRPDWCISRQRAWGVPIPSLICNDCSQSTLTRDICLHVAGVFKKTSADAWDTLPLKELIPEKLLKCAHCGSKNLEKENNVLDVWFDSGISFSAVIQERLGKDISDLYLEGNDQYRGWFQSSLLAACGWQQKPSYKAVVTHGMILDENGHKYSKSSANFEPPETFIKTRGADVMRLWVASESFQEDMTFSPENIKRVEDVYRKIRNTLRFMLGVCEPMSAPPSANIKLARPLHQYMFSDFLRWCDEVQAAYHGFEFNHVFHLFNTLMTTDLSSFYLDICKDSLYCDKKSSAFRQEAVNVISFMAYTCAHYLAPITSFMAEDIYRHFPLTPKAESIFLSPTTYTEKHLTAAYETYLNTHQKPFELIHRIRDQVQIECEPLRRDKKIKTNAQARVTLKSAYLPDELQSHLDQLALYFGVSEVILNDTLLENIRVEPTPHARCERCWNYRPEVTTLPKPDLCQRCSSIIGDSH